MRQLFKLKRQNLPFWGVYSQRIRTAYYENSDVYKDHWRRRAELLIDMFENREAETGIVYEVAEFGCGPNAPVSSICMDKKQYKSTKFDIKRWDSDTNILNLNDKNIEIPSSNIAVFSGVLEYLDDIESVLRRCMENCDYILLSYAFVPSLFQKIPFLSEYIYLKEINMLLEYQTLLL